MGQALISLVVGALCGLTIAKVYRMTYRETGYSTSFVQSLVAFAVITTLVIMVIGNNLARAFGLVGSMSIIRFRMAIKDTRDIVFIFFSLAIGMACGVQLFVLAVVATLFIGSLIYSLSSFGLFEPYRREYILKFCYHGPNGDGSPYIDVLTDHTQKHRLVNLKSIDDTTLDLTYFIRLRRPDDGKKIVQSLSGMGDISRVNLFYDEE